MGFSHVEDLIYQTTRIEVDCGHAIVTGTAFYFTPDSGQTFFLVTNKHVVDGARRFSFCSHSMDNKPGFVNFSLDRSETRWIEHPTRDIDLVALPVPALSEKAKAIGRTLRITAFSERSIPTTAQLKQLLVMEEVVMAGYPNGLWDDVNNFPIIRRGVTATSAAVDYQGRSEFVVDIAAFPGSSGSPIVLINETGFITNTMRTVRDRRFQFLGVLHAGPVMNAEGNLVMATIPSLPRIHTPMMLHLGLAIKSHEVLALCTHAKASCPSVA